MSLKELKKPAQSKVQKQTPSVDEKQTKEFIASGGRLAGQVELAEENHRLTLRIPKWLLDKVDVKRRQRVGTISRNLWILELIERATKKL